MKPVFLLMFLFSPTFLLAGGTGICVTPDGRNVPCSSGPTGGSSGGNRGGSTYNPGPSKQQLEKQNEQNFYSLNQKGFDAYKRQDWDNAIYYFERALSLSPANPDAKHNLKRAREKKADRDYQRQWEEQQRRAAEVARIEEEKRRQREAALAQKRKAKRQAQKQKQKRDINKLSKKSPNKTAAKKKEMENQPPNPPPIEKKDEKSFLNKMRTSFKEWTMSETYDLTIGKLPGMATLKSLTEKGKRMFEDLLGLNQNVYDKAMEGMQDGVDTAGSDRLSDGGLSDNYDKRLKATQEETEKKSKAMVKESLK